MSLEMKKLSFHIRDMDCPSEENLVRLKLGVFPSIELLVFDLEKRNLEVYHTSENEKIIKALDSLKLGAKLTGIEDVAKINPSENSTQKKVLWTVLIINFGFFLIEMTTGIISNSMGLVADSLDMLADSFVYALSLFAVGASVHIKNRIANTAGYFQIGLALLGFIEILRRFFGFVEVPEFKTMITVSILALIANSVCLSVLQKSSSKEAHMRASMIFTSNDVIINLGVLIAGLLVMWSGSNKPDLIIGSIVFVVVIKGAFRILSLSKDNA